MENQFIDAEFKIIVDCPYCGNQAAIYLIRSNRLTEGLESLQCDSCGTIYVVEIETEIKCRTAVYECQNTAHKEERPHENEDD